jgi:hypothetical protein
MLFAMLFPAPAAPAFPPDHASTNPLYPRYEDCTQDGRLNTLAVPPALATLWNSRDHRSLAASQARSSGLISLLTRLTVTSLDQPVRVNRPFEANCGFQLAHDRDAAGAVSRLFMNVWCEVRGRPHVPAAQRVPGGGRELALAGQAFAEHTYTRPFGPPDQRRVISFAGIDGMPDVPEPRYHQPAPASAAEAPDGATWLDELAADPVDTAFLLDHTDANQHVNSLVYVRLYLDAMCRRLAAARQPAKLRSRGFDIAYRKPSFVGDRIRAHIRLFTHGELVGGAGFLAAAGEEARPRCYVRAVYGP